MADDKRPDTFDNEDDVPTEIMDRSELEAMRKRLQEEDDADDDTAPSEDASSGD